MIYCNVLICKDTSNTQLWMKSRNVYVWWHWHLLRHMGTGHLVLLLLLAAFWVWPPGCRQHFNVQCLLSPSFSPPFSNQRWESLFSHHPFLDLWSDIFDHRNFSLPLPPFSVGLDKRSLLPFLTFLLPLPCSISDQRRPFPSNFTFHFLPSCSLSLPSPPLAFRTPCPTRAGPLWPAAVFTVNTDQC